MFLLPHHFALFAFGALLCINAGTLDDSTDIGTALFISRKGDEIVTSFQNTKPSSVRRFGDRQLVPRSSWRGPARTLKYSGCSETHNTISAIVECSNAVRKNPDQFANDYPCAYQSWRHEVSGKNLSPLKTGSTIMRLAQLHTDDQARMNAMSHQGSDGSDLQTRADRISLPWGTVAENVAVGFSSAKAVVMAWMCSPGHRKNLMSCDFSTLGVGIGVSNAGRTFYTQVFSCGISEKCSCGSKGGGQKRHKKEASFTGGFQQSLQQGTGGVSCGWINGQWQCGHQSSSSTHPNNPFGY